MHTQVGTAEWIRDRGRRGVSAGARFLRDRALTVRDVGYGSLPTARSTRANRLPGSGPQGRIPV